MLDTINKDVFLYNQLKTISNIVFAITFMLILSNNEYNIIPLNFIVLIGSLFLFHVYPNYYNIVKNHDKTIIPYLALLDIIVHYLPIVYIISKNIQNTTKTNYSLCLIIIFAYIAIFYKDIYSIYLRPEIYLKNPTPAGQDLLANVQ
jgi:hypothetical protein